MPHSFEPAIVAAVLRHMNDDHPADNVLITRAFGPDAAVTSATMVGFDGEGGEWSATDASGAPILVRAAWPGGSITERPEVRREIVALYDASCARLGVEPRPHS